MPNVIGFHLNTYTCAPASTPNPAPGSSSMVNPRLSASCCAFPKRAIVRGTMARFGNAQQLADSRGLTIAELPGAGFGVDAGAHVYVFKWKPITFGIGGQL